MKVIIYTRQSKHRDESVSHELQETACRNVAVSRGWEVVRVLQEKGVSGRSIDKRKEFQAAVKMIEDKEAEGLLVWRWSRFARNTLDALITLKFIEEEAKGQVHCALEQIDRSAMGKFSLTMMLGMAELESNVKSEQWKEALMRRVNLGLPPSGKVQFGYDKQGKEKYVQNADAETLREAYKRYTAGVGVRTICEDFAARGLPAPGPKGWHSAGLFDLLDKSFYAGKISYEGKEFPGAHEPILDAAQWAAYRKARDSRKLQTKPRNPKWMLSGLVVCGLCGGKMLSHMARGVPNLMCATYNAKGAAGCPGMFRKRSKVQQAVWWWLGSHLDEWASAMPTDDEARLAAGKAVADAEIALEAARDTYQRYQAFAFENGIRPDESKASLAKYSAEIDTAQTTLDDALAELGSRSPASDVHEQISNGALLMGFEANSDAVPTEAATAQFREALSKIIEKVIVHPATGKSPRDPNRDHRSEVEVVVTRKP